MLDPSSDVPTQLRTTGKPRLRDRVLNVLCLVAGVVGGFLCYGVYVFGIVEQIKQCSGRFLLGPASIGLIFVVLAGVWRLIRRKALREVVATKVSSALVGCGMGVGLGLLVRFLDALADADVPLSSQYVVFAVGLTAISAVAVEVEAACLRLWGRSNQVGALFSGAATVATKQASLAKLNTVTFPRLYHQIGKAICDLPKLPAELASYRDAVHTLRQDLEASLSKDGDTPSESATFLDKAKRVAMDAAKKASDAATGARLQAAYVQLGSAATKRYGERCVPKAIRADYEAAQSQKAAIEREIDAVSSTTPAMGWLTPRRLAVAGGVFGVVLVLGAIQTLRTVSSRDGAPIARGISTDSSSSVASPSPVRTQSVSASSVSRFEAECDQVCSEMLAAYRAVSPSPRDMVVSAGEKLEEIGRDPEKGMNGIGISAGCAKAMMTYLGMCSFLSIEAAARCAGQELPDGGMVGMVNSMLNETDVSLRASGNSEKYWTHMALVRASMRLYADTNTFNAEFERQLIDGGAQPVAIRELQRLRHEILSLLSSRYSAGIEYGVERHGEPPFSER